MRNTVIAIAIALLLSIALYASIIQNQRLKVENKRVNNNFVVATNRITYFKTADSLKAARVGVLNLRVGELESYNSNLKDGLKAMGIRIKDVENISAHGITSAYKVIETLRDSVKYLANQQTGKIDTVAFRYAKYNDKWISFYQEQIESSITTDIKTRDSIVVVQHWERYKFLFFRWGKKNHHETVVTYNPHSRVDFTLSIDVQ